MRIFIQCYFQLEYLASINHEEELKEEVLKKSNLIRHIPDPSFKFKKVFTKEKVEVGVLGEDEDVKKILLGISE